MHIVKPHYVLKLFVDSDDTKLLNLYKEAVHKHNSVVQKYLDDVDYNKAVHFDAGFDLFCPKTCIIGGKQTEKLNHGVKTAMEFVNGVSLVTPPLSNGMCNGCDSHASASHAPASHAPASHASASHAPVGYYLYPRSSTGTKTPLRLANSVGIIDSGYRGHIIAVFDNWKDDTFVVEKYQRMAQLCPPNLTYPIYVTMVDSDEDLGVTNRGTGGFGSTGN